MEITKLIEICKQKKYPEEFSHDLVCMYPFMVRKYGYEIIDKLLTEWKYVFFNNPGASGNCVKNKKEIGVNLYGWSSDPMHLYRTITATTHEVEHAIATLDFNDTSFLNDGKENLDDFFSKMDEAIVSDYQDDLLVGELEYNYSDSYNFKCRGDLSHFETSYPYEKFYFNIFKIILGNDAKLIKKMMYTKDKDIKKDCFENIVQIINSKLRESQFKEIINSCAILIYNHGYGLSIRDRFFDERKEIEKSSLFEYNYDIVKKQNVKYEEYKQYFDSWYENMCDKKYSKVRKIIFENNLNNTSIKEQCDKLSEVTIDYLIEGLEKMQNFDFELIRSACLYFTKINNKNPKLIEKNYKLNELLINHLSKLNITLSKSITSKYNVSEILTILIKLISLNNMSILRLDNLRIIYPSKSTNFTYFTDGINTYKLGKYRDLPKDEFEKYHDPYINDIYLDVINPEVKLSRGLVFGDPLIKNKYIESNDVLLKVSVKEKYKNR